MNRKLVAIWGQSALYIGAGLNHFRTPQTYASIIPSVLPHPLSIVYVSGAIEIGLGGLLLFQSTQRMAAIGIIILLIAVFPANIKMCIDYVAHHHAYAWVTILRLPLQFVLIFLAWWSMDNSR